MNKSTIFLLVLATFLFTFNACDPSKKTVKTPTTDMPEMEIDDGMIEVIFLQMNDVYEIAPLEGGKVGGLARVATIREQLLEENPHVITVLAGDFLNPSLIGTLKYEGERIKGKHIVETMNAMKVDLVTVGNHEFDLDEDELQARINESNFEWVVANVLQKDTAGNLSPFAKRIEGSEPQNFPETYQLNLTDEDGTNVSIGILSVCLDANKRDYVHYDEVFESAIQAYGQMKPETDFIVGLTHLNVEDDLELAKKLPLPLIMGGHDHDNMYHEVGTSKVAKADANAKTVYVHRLSFNKKTGTVKVNSELVAINDQIEEDEEVAEVVNKWNSIADKSMRDAGFDPNETITTLKEPLDGREKTMRNGPTNMGEMITNAMLKAAPKSVAAFFNSGSVRLDDFLKGAITQVDIIRTLPFGGSIVEVEMSGELLHEILVVGRENAGTGGYLQLQKIEYIEADDIWKVNGKTLNPTTTYRVALTDFLLTGLEKDLDFLTRDNPEIFKIYEAEKGDMDDLRGDVRRAIIDYLQK